MKKTKIYRTVTDQPNLNNFELTCKSFFYITNIIMLIEDDTD